MKIEVYSDGSGTSATRPAGYGWVIVINGDKYKEGYGNLTQGTNNDAELEGAIQGLANVLKIRNENSLTIEAHEVTLVSDSQIVLGWVDGSYRFKQTAKMHKYQQLQYLVRKLNVKTRWVEGHTGDEHNERCDKLAHLGRTGEEKKSKKTRKSVPIKVVYDLIAKVDDRDVAASLMEEFHKIMENL